MKKGIIVIGKKYSDIDQEQLSMQRYNLVLSNNTSIIDLPPQVSEVLINNNTITFKAISWCMFPVIWAGDILKIEPIKPKSAKIGDIILYKSVGRAYAHRLVNTYNEKGRLFIVTSGEKEYRENRFSNYGGILADNILGKLTEIKRGKLCFSPDDVKLHLWSLMQGKLKLSVWTFTHKIKQNIAKIFTKLQRAKLYRYLLKIFTKDKVAFFVGASLIKNKGEINNFCFYRSFMDFSKDFTGEKGLYHINARINNWPVGNISLFFDTDGLSRKTCILSNFIVRIPFRGGGIGHQLLEKALYLCNKTNIGEVKVNLFGEDKIAYKLFLKSGFDIY